MRPLQLTIAPITLCLAASAALAQTPDERVRISILDPVVVTATRLDQDVFSVPYTAHVVGRERFIEERAVRSLADALSETPGVLIQRTSYGQASPTLRGFTGFRTLLLIDGIRLNNAVFREGPNQYFATIDALTADRLDVVKGPSSTLYGSDAIGGTVNVHTRNPEMLPWPDTGEAKTVLDGKATAGAEAAPMQQPQRFAFHPGAFYRYASAENSQTARGEFGLALSPHVGVLGGVTWKDFDDLRGGGVIGLQPNSGYSEIDGDVKFLIRPNEDVDITAAFYRTEQKNVPRTHATVFGKSFDGTDIGTDLRRDLDQKRELAYVQTEVREVAPWLGRVGLSLSFHRQTEEQDRIRGDNGRREITGFEDVQYGALLAFESPSPIGTWTYGAEYYHDEVQSHGRDFNADGSLRGVRARGPVADDASYDLLGIYVQNQFRPWEPLEITLGARHSWAQAQADGDKIDPTPGDALTFDDLDKSFDAFTGSLRVRLDVARDWNFFGGVSQGFRAPNLSDFTSFELARSGEQETPANDLDSEHFTSFEIGTKVRVPQLGIEAYAAYFYTLIDDQIVRFPTGQLIGGASEVTRANVGDGYIQGVEIGAEWRFWDGFRLFGNLTWTEGELDTFVGSNLEAQPADRIPPLSSLLGLRWDSTDGRWFLEGTAQLARREDRLSPGDVNNTQRIPPGGTRGYQVFTARAGCNVTPQWRLTAAVENISNEDYRTHGSGLNEPGTNVVLTSQVRF
jgi:hemoglobin/transferrin/lactoferrin receptor protein